VPDLRAASRLLAIHDILGGPADDSDALVAEARQLFVPPATEEQLRTKADFETLWPYFRLQPKQETALALLNLQNLANVMRGGDTGKLARLLRDCKPLIEDLLALKGNAAGDAHEVLRQIERLQPFRRLLEHGFHPTRGPSAEQIEEYLAAQGLPD